MSPYEVFDHTADIGLRITARNLDELFAEAGRALFAVLLENPQDVGGYQQVEVQLKAEAIDLLLVDWLRELLYLFETQHLVFRHFEVTVNEQRKSLTATCMGEPVDWQKHQPGTEVKAVTYHGLRVERRDDGWIAEVILDI